MNRLSIFSSFFSALILLTSSVASSEYMEVKGPPIAEHKEIQRIFRRGENVKLLCPISGFPAPMIEWSRDGESIDYTWERHRAGRKALKIRNVHEDDTGVYTCRGVNGFGTEKVRVVLHVVDPRQFPDGAMAPPVFTKDTMYSDKHLSLAVGERFKISCEALGSPQPEVYWFKDGIHIHEPVQSGPRGGSSTVEMGIMSVDDAGVYSCRARNLAGERSMNFTLKVESGPATGTAAIVTEVGPDPAEVEVGGAMTLTCKVKALSRPSVKWLKKLDQAEAGISPDALTVGNIHYRVMEHSENVIMGSDVYQTNLRMHNVKHSDSGMYICFVTSNNYGFTFKAVTLKVLERSSVNKGTVAINNKPAVPVTPQAGTEPKAILVLVIILSVIVVVLLLCIVIWVIRKRAKTPPTEILRPEESPDMQRPFMVKPIQQQQAQQAFQQPQVTALHPQQHQWGRTAVYPEYLQQQQQQYMKLMTPCPPGTDSGFDASLTCSAPSPKELNTYEVPYAHLMASNGYHMQQQQQQQPRPYQFGPRGSSNNPSLVSSQRRAAPGTSSRQYPTDLRRNNNGSNTGGSSASGRNKHHHRQQPKYISDYESQ